MVAARAAFLDAGHLAPISSALAHRAATDAPGVIADVGAGTGHHLGAVLDAHPERAGIALDSSTPALRRAAKAHARIVAVACDAWSALPVRDDAAAVVLSVFAPRGAAEIRRILAPGGVVLAVTPTGSHLAELREPLGLLRIDPGKADRLADDLGVRESERHAIEATIELSRDEALLVAAMGPSAHHDRATADLPDTIAVTLSVELTVLCCAP
jgi:23S rRNA (guanine745-N1)-methyltransferase